MIIVVTGPWALPRMEIARAVAGRLGGVEVVDGEQLGFALMEFRTGLPENFQEDPVWQALFTSLCVHTARHGSGCVLAPMNVHSSERLSLLRADIARRGETVHVVGLRAPREYCERLADTFSFFERDSADYHRVRNWQLARLGEYLEFVEHPRAPVDHWIDLLPDASSEWVVSPIAQAMTPLLAKR
ncbi:hypothetical protein OH786_03455 [Streptomyces atratus]|uniref:AAA domain-containing protein n=1 Tax=Streptomyces atratus TaxID=1893 RepID=A0A1K2CAL5_STRAR|nr:hypothetical protein [Streptomyces atratus]SFY07404.1 hypothetical protein SAMN02787144_1010145 [Streptomyces atratus]